MTKHNEGQDSTALCDVCGLEFGLFTPQTFQRPLSALTWYDLCGRCHAALPKIKRDVMFCFPSIGKPEDAK